ARVRARKAPRCSQALHRPRGAAPTKRRPASHGARQCRPPASNRGEASAVRSCRQKGEGGPIDDRSGLSVRPGLRDPRGCSKDRGRRADRRTENRRAEAGEPERRQWKMENGKWKMENGKDLASALGQEKRRGRWSVI